MADEVFHRIEREPFDHAEPRPHRRGEEPEAGRRADQREAFHRHRQRLRVRSVAEPDVDAEVLHRRVEEFLELRPEAVDLVDEQHVAGAEAGEQADEVAGPLQHRTRGGAALDAHLARDQHRQRGLAEARGAEEEDVVERLAAPTCRVDRDLQRGADLLLPDELVEPRRAQRRLGASLVGKRRGRGHLDAAVRSSATSRRRGQPAHRPLGGPQHVLGVTGDAAVGGGGRARPAPACGWWRRNGCIAIPPSSRGSRSSTSITSSSGCVNARRMTALVSCSAPASSTARTAVSAAVAVKPRSHQRADRGGGGRRHLVGARCRCRKIVEMVRQFERDPFRLLASDAGDARQRGEVLVANGADGAIGAEGRQDREGQARSDPARRKQASEHHPLARGVEAEEEPARLRAPPVRCAGARSAPAAGSRSKTPSGTWSR